MHLFFRLEYSMHYLFAHKHIQKSCQRKSNYIHIICQNICQWTWLVFCYYCDFTAILKLDKTCYAHSLICSHLQVQCGNILPFMFVTRHFMRVCPISKYSCIDTSITVDYLITYVFVIASVRSCVLIIDEWSHFILHYDTDSIIHLTWFGG